MEVHLLKERTIIQSGACVIRRRFIRERNRTEVKSAFKSQTVKITPVIDTFSGILSNPCIPISALRKEPDDQDLITEPLNSELFVTVSLVSDGLGNVSLDGGRGDNILMLLRRLSPSNTLGISLKNFNFRWMSTREEYNFTCNDLKIKGGNGFAYVKGSFSFPTELWTPEEVNLGYECEITVTARIDPHSRGLVLANLHGNQFAGIGRKMLDEMQWSDLCLVASNGAEFPCHKVIVSANCEVLKRKMENMKDSPCCLELSDISENGARALLDFVYCRSVMTPSADIGIAVELLTVGSNLGSACLEQVMLQLILYASNDSFQVKQAVGLLRNARQMLDGDRVKEELQRKAVKILAWFQRNSPDTLEKCEDYRVIFQDKAWGMEFSLLILEVLRTTMN